MLIEDGRGSGRRVEVDPENMLRVLATMQTLERHTNQEHGQAYHAPFDKAPTANDDCIFYLQNLSDTDLIVEGFWLSVSAVCELYFKLNAIGTRNAAAAITPVNVNAKSGNEADCTCEQGVDLDGGAAELTGGTEVERYVFRAAGDSEFFNFEQDIVLGKNDTLTVWGSIAAAVANGTAVINFHD